MGNERYDRVDQYEQVQALAHRLERATGELRKNVVRHTHLRSPRQMEALAAVRRLEVAARHFHGTVERTHGPLHLESDLRDMTQAFRYAQARANALHTPRGLDRDYDRVERLVRELRVAYADVARHGHAGRYAEARPVFPIRWFVAQARWR